MQQKTSYLPDPGTDKEFSAYTVLKQYWDFDEFREGQKESVLSVLNGADTLVLFPTGGGKSLCYQVPALVLDGLTLVISPLVALMFDQVEQLRKRGIPATFINSTLSRHELEQRLLNARNGMYKLLYCSPERLHTPLFKEHLLDLNISLVAVDEAHCISQWGYDFRPAYQKISEGLADLPPTTCKMALTATATPEVREDILHSLSLKKPTIISLPFSRPNLVWWVTKSKKREEQLYTAVSKASKKGDGIVYAPTRKKCEEYALNFRTNNIKAEAYHAGIDASEREAIQKRWIFGKTPVVCSTNAFGMGVDKPDCRFVLHHQMPATLEAYYQEAGRAGRDGKTAYPVLFFRDEDYLRMEQLMKASYPEVETVQKVYDVLCDELELTLGAIQEEAVSLHTEALRKRSGLPNGVIKAALRELQKYDVIELFSIEQPSVGIHFVMSEQLIRSQIEQSSSGKRRDFVDALMRMMGRNAWIEMEFQKFEFIEKRTRLKQHQIIRALDILQKNDRMLEYEIRDDGEYVYLKEARQRKVPIDVASLKNFRNTQLKKLELMKGYASTKGCREMYIRAYFGEENLMPCGVCDNCVATKMTIQKTSVSDDIVEIIKILSTGSHSVFSLQKATEWEFNRINNALSYLIKEGIITNKVEEGEELYRTT